MHPKWIAHARTDAVILLSDDEEDDDDDDDSHSDGDSDRNELSHKLPSFMSAWPKELTSTRDQSSWFLSRFRFCCVYYLYILQLLLVLSFYLLFMN